VDLGAEFFSLHVWGWAWVWVGEQVRVLVVTKDDGIPPRTHATVFYNPTLPSNEIVENADIVDPASQPGPA
jgi:hypothetical protein